MKKMSNIVTTTEQLFEKIAENEKDIILKEGTYYLSETLDINGSDIEIKAEEGEKVIISGGQRLNCNWKAYENGIWVSEIEKGLDFTQLYINGKRQIRARYPNEGEYVNPAKTELEWPHTSMVFDEFSNKKWSKPSEAVLHIFAAEYWGNMQWQINDIDYENKKVLFGKGGFQVNDIMQGKDATGIDHRSKYYIENVFEELDAPHEWYYDKEKGLLYYMPYEGLYLENAIIEVSNLKRLINISGAKNIKISDIEFAHTESTYLDTYEALSLGDWTICRNAAIYMENAEDCVVENCIFDGLGGNGIFLSNYNKGNIISNSTFCDLGESAVCVVGNKYKCLGTQKYYPYENTITGNHMYNIGVYGKQTAGVFVSVASDITISHNHIHDVPRAAICINDGTWGGHIIEYNDIHDTVKETGDHGPFNSWGRDRFWCLMQSHHGESHPAGNVLLDAKKTTVIRNNRFEDYKGWGIDLDDGSSNYHVYNNLCIGISVKLREGDFRVIENNIFINAANPPGFHIGYENNCDKFMRNIVVMNSRFDNPEVDIDFKKFKSSGALYEIIGPPEKGKWFELDYNLFYNDIGSFKAIVNHRPLRDRIKKEYSLNEWQEMGFDEHSIYADPMFVDAENVDFRLKPDSPAFKLGFKEFDIKVRNRNPGT